MRISNIKYSSTKKITVFFQSVLFIRLVPIDANINAARSPDYHDLHIVDFFGKISKMTWSLNGCLIADIFYIEII